MALALSLGMSATQIQDDTLQTIRGLGELSSYGRVDLRCLRGELSEYGRCELDAALIALQLDGRIDLVRNDNTPAITAADRASAIEISGYPRHMVFAR